MSVIKKRKVSDLYEDDVQNEGCSSGNDKLYFTSYADIELHRTMIEDQVRTNAYKDAILNPKKNFIKDKVVVDVGCGTGILSMFCAKAGAKKVYAIDASKIASHAEKVIKQNGYEEIISVIYGKAEEIELPEKVDVIVSEWMGYMLLYETMLPSVLHIRDKYLKPDGKMFPERATLNISLGESGWIRKFQEDAYDFWISMIPTYDLDMVLLADEAVKKFKETVHVQMVAQQDVMSSAVTVSDLNLYTVKADDLKNITSAFELSSMGARELNCLVVWFDVQFPDCSSLTTSPFFEDTHWLNTILPVDEKKLTQDDKCVGTITIKQDSDYFRYLNIDIEYKINGGDIFSKKYILNDGE